MCEVLIGHTDTKMTSYNLFLECFGHLANPSIEQAYFLYEFDGAPKEFEDAMVWYGLAFHEPFGHRWCSYIWQSKLAWNAYKRAQGFPLAVAFALSTTCTPRGPNLNPNP